MSGGREREQGTQIEGGGFILELSSLDMRTLSPTSMGRVIVR